MTTNKHTATGRLSDGLTAAASDVEVTIGADGLEIQGPGSSWRVWPYATLTAAEPITRHAIDALLHSSTEPQASLFVADKDFARKLPDIAPQLSPRATRWRDAKPWAAAAIGVLALIGILTALDVSPSHAIATLLPDKARAALGKEALDSMVKDRRVCTSPQGLAALERLTTRLRTGAPDTKFKIIVVDWGMMNAFAVPGEQIVLTKGLLNKAGDPDEIAGVLAHEMGHGLKLHPETGLIRAMGLSAGAQLLLGGSTGTLANFGVLLAELSNSRAAEHEADITGLQPLKAGGVSAQGLGKFFIRVLALEGEDAGTNRVLNLLRSHPLTAERQKLVESQPAYPSTPSLSKKDWEALRSICDEPGAVSAP